jgi:general secretion pathway protein N
MKNWLVIGGIFLSVYLAFVIAAVPAHLALSYVNLPKNMVLNGVKGTIWDMTVDEIVHSKITIDNVQASLSFWSFFTLDPSLAVEFGDDFSAGPSGYLSMSGLLNTMVISDAELVVSANTIAQQLPLPVPLVASGDIKLLINTFILGQPVCQETQGNITWQTPSISALNKTVKLGRLEAKLSCEQGALALTMDEKNDLGLSFITYVRSNGLSGNGHLTPAKKFPDNLKAVLPFLGKPDKQGRYRLGF